MAEHQSRSPPESTESLLKKLCFILAESKQDVADSFYALMRDCLSTDARTSKKPSTPGNASHSSSTSTLSSHAGCSTSLSDSRNDFSADNEFIIDHKKVLQYLSIVDKNVAREFSELSDKIQHDRNIFLSDRIASLKFLLKMGKKGDKSDELILPQQKIAMPDFKNKKSNRPVSTTENTGTLNSLPSPKVEEIYSVNAKSSSGSLDSAARSTSISANGSRMRALNGSSGLQRLNSQRPDSSLSRSHLRLSKSHLVKADEIDSKYSDLDNVLSEWQIIRGIIFTWQGIEGDIFKLNSSTHLYYINEKFAVERTTKEKAENLALLGYLHNELHKFTQEPVIGGMVRKCLIAYVRDRLSDYYSLIANIQTQFQDEVTRETLNSGLHKSLVTLERLRLLSLYPMRTFQDLISILEFTENEQGGYLASGIHSFIEHGDPDLQCLVKGVLSEVCKPLYSMLTKWLLDGELCDPHKEFFIASDNNISGDRLWHDKYTLRMSMLPEFISVQLSEKILSVGKSINFLREICGDEEPYSEREKMRELFLNADVEVMYLLEKEDEMQRLIDPAYKETNKRVMNVLINKYSLLDHFQAHRKYLLLGQGDFIHHFMDLLVEVLEKPADQLHPHHLNSILDSAIRATTAQYDDENILNRLDAATMGHSRSDTGWDVFYLRYHVDGPIGTVFSLSKDVYQLLFYALWKAKRMEMVLSKLWKRQITSAKMFRKISELSPLLRQCNELTSEMVHFILQTQYYFLFEVLECSWNQLIEQIHHAETLDEVISAHQHFLLNVKAGVFRDEYHEDLSNQLGIVYNLILQLNSEVEQLMTHSQREVTERSRYIIPNPEDLRQWCLNDPEKIEFIKKRNEFVQKFIPNSSANLKILAKTYRDTVKKFLLMLNSQHDLSLQLLSIRLDFNEHYKNLDSRLVAPLTFQHRRLSSMGDAGMLPFVNSKLYSSRKRSNDEVDDIPEQ